MTCQTMKRKDKTGNEEKNCDDEKKCIQDLFSYIVYSRLIIEICKHREQQCKMHENIPGKYFWRQPVDENVHEKNDGTEKNKPVTADDLSPVFSQQ